MYHNFNYFLGGGGLLLIYISFISGGGGGGGGGEYPALAWYTVSVCACSDDLCDYAFDIFRVQFHV